VVSNGYGIAGVLLGKSIGFVATLIHITHTLRFSFDHKCGSREGSQWATT
jgi:hypothetical protein